MALYEMRTYTLYVGKMGEAQKLYTELGFPALKKGGHDKNLVGYFVADTGMINQLVHIWKFKDDADRRAHWAAVFANKDFVEGFASKFRPLVMSQEVKLMTEEFSRVSDMYKRNLIPVTRVLSAERDLTRLQGERGQLVSGIARAEKEISEINVQII